ncbi:FecR domain-containing protein [Adhaeribacter aquaticus]|uniref:FecR domain-containing protein n=1 Tax=Adhaeribacter aquaticus TaxID=299567 RepID=UPI00041AA5D2|nr:FecR domain-containing protein [Adhaeribacter aquaticus]
MNDNRPTYWEKLAREVSGNASEADKAWIRQQQEQDKELEEAHLQAERLWQGTPLPDEKYEPNVESGWQRFQFKVQARETARPVAEQEKKSSNWIWAVAASISLLLVVGAYFLTKKNEPAWTEIKTAMHETQTIHLADGSTVSLNQNSTFSYPVNFQQENRTVRLKGEAFFEVAKAEGKRFTIFAEGTKTEVIGTSFNLRAYENEPVKVQVVSGKVAFARTATDDAIFLIPGQEGVLTNNEIVPAVKQPIKNSNFQAWKTKSLEFNNVELAHLVLELESHFNVKFRIQDNLRNCRFTTSFKDPDLKEVLDILALTGNLTITQNGNQYVISGSGCK